MTDQQKTEAKEEKSQAQLDYEAGQEFLKNLEPAQAANAFHNALIAFEIEGNEDGVANAADKLGDICAVRGDVTTALSHYDRAYAICQKHKDRFSLFSIEKKKAKLMYDAKNYDQAIRLYAEVLDEYSALRNPQGSVDTLETMAEIYLIMGKKSKAADSYLTAAAIHQSFRHSRQAEKFRQKAAEAEG